MHHDFKWPQTVEFLEPRNGYIYPNVGGLYEVTSPRIAYALRNREIERKATPRRAPHRKLRNRRFPGDTACGWRRTTSYVAHRPGSRLLVAARPHVMTSAFPHCHARALPINSCGTRFLCPKSLCVQSPQHRQHLCVKRPAITLGQPAAG